MNKQILIENFESVMCDKLAELFENNTLTFDEIITAAENAFKITIESIDN